MAAIRYYPMSRVLTGQYTNGGRYYNATTNQQYVGPYYITYDGKVFSGPNPATGPNEPLVTQRRSSALNRMVNLITTGQGEESPAPQVPAQKLRQLVPYTPVVTQEDYDRGYIKRYFVKRIVDRGYIIEVSYSDWTVVQNKLDKTYETYEAAEILWQLVGPRNDTRISQYEIKGGVYDTNKRVVEKKAKSFVGLVEFIGGDYTKFARITN